MMSSSGCPAIIITLMEEIGFNVGVQLMPPIDGRD